RCLAEFSNKTVVTVLLENCTPPSDVQHLHYINLSVDSRSNMPSLISAVFAGANRTTATSAEQLSTGSSPKFNTTGTSGDVYNPVFRDVQGDMHIGRKEVKD